MRFHFDCRMREARGSAPRFRAGTSGPSMGEVPGAGGLPDREGVGVTAQQGELLYRGERFFATYPRHLGGFSCLLLNGDTAAFNNG